MNTNAFLFLANINQEFFHPSTCGWNGRNYNPSPESECPSPTAFACEAGGGSCGSALLRRGGGGVLVPQSLSRIQYLGTAVGVQSGGRAHEFDSCIFRGLDG